MGIRAIQYEVVQDDGFRGAVEASAMAVAHEVLTEDESTPGHEQRVAVAAALFQGDPGDIERFTRLFAWKAVFDQTVQLQVWKNGEVSTDDLDDDLMDSIVRDFWDMAALYRDASSPEIIVPDEPEAPEGPGEDGGEPEGSDEDSDEPEGSEEPVEGGVE